MILDEYGLKDEGVDLTPFDVMDRRRQLRARTLAPEP
jgi:hypothetical protein